MSLAPDVKRPVETIERAVRIIEYIKLQGPSRIAELDREFDCAKSTLHRHLKTLEAQELLVENDGEYRLGLRFLEYGSVARDRNTFFQEAKNTVHELNDEIGESVWCTFEEHGKGTVICGAWATRSIQTPFRTGQSHFLHSHSAGKAILAHIPSERTQNIIETYGLPAQTPHTITDAETLRAELEETRERGFAVDCEEAVEGFDSVSAPITNQNGDAIGAISIASPTERGDEERLTEEFPPLLIDAVSEITIDLAPSKYCSSTATGSGSSVPADDGEALPLHFARHFRTDSNKKA